MKGASYALERQGLGALVAALIDDGYAVVAPVRHEGALMLREIGSADELPWGVVDEQHAATYRLVETGEPVAFGAAHGPQPWKRVLFPPRSVLFRARRNGGGFEMELPDDDPPRLALLGVRACDLAAFAILDRVLAEGAHPDPTYVRRRTDAFVVAVQCTRPGGTCFCASTGSGPEAGPGADLVLTELGDGTLLAEPRSDAATSLLAQLPHRPASEIDVDAARAAVAAAGERMGLALRVDGLADALHHALESSRWEDVAARCLGCGNCTLVCPTCFCTTVDDGTDLTGDHTERRRRWDSCFTAELSYIHGGSVRASTAARYRQWLTHKLGTWADQFGTPGCVGCGRCITWCPAGIDLTAEATALREEVASCTPSPI